MKTQKCLSTLSLAATGLILGASQALATPLLDSDLASFTVLGASAERSIPQSADAHADAVQAIAAINAAPARSGLSQPMPGSQPGVGAAVSQLAQALRLAAPDHHAASDGPVGNNGKPSWSPARDEPDLFRKYLCAMAQAMTPVAESAAALCRELAPPPAFQALASPPGLASAASANRPAGRRTDGTDDTGDAPADLQQALLLATLPGETMSDSAGGMAAGWSLPATGANPATDFVAFPAALLIAPLAATVPEPATLTLLAFGLAGLACRRKRAA